MRRALLACVVIILLMSFSGSALADFTSPETVSTRQTGPYAVSSGAVYVRGGPGIGFWVVTTLYGGEIIPILAVSPDMGWWYVSTAVGNGWVSNIAVTAYNTATVAVRNPGPIGMVISAVLNVREGAGPNAYRLGQLSRGQQVYVTGQNSTATWYQVQWAYGTGWVSAQHLAVSGGTIQVVLVDADGQGGMVVGEVDAIPMTAPAPYGIVMAAYLNVRSGPSINNTILGQVYGGQELPITGQSTDGRWYEVTTQIGSGWVFADYLLPRNEYGSLPDTTDNQQTSGLVGPVGIVNTGALNLRTGPGSHYTVVGTLAGGAEGIIIGRNRDWSWWLMETDAGTGWASSLYIVVRGDTYGVPYAEPGTDVSPSNNQPGGTAPDAEAAFPVAVVNTGALHIRSGPNSAFASIGTVEMGTRMDILGQSPDHGWWMVDSPFGIGWVSKLLVVVDGDISDVPVQ